MMRISEERGATRHKGECKYVTKMQEEEFLRRQDDLDMEIFKCEKSEHAAQFMAIKESTLHMEREYKGGEDI